MNVLGDRLGPGHIHYQCVARDFSELSPNNLIVLQFLCPKVKPNSQGLPMDFLHLKEILVLVLDEVYEWTR